MNYPDLVITMHKKCLSDYTFGNYLKQLFEDALIRVVDYDNNLLENPFHSVDIKKRYINAYIINFSIGGYGKLFRSDVTVPLEKFTVYKNLLDFLTKLFTRIYMIEPKFISNAFQYEIDKEQEIKMKNSDLLESNSLLKVPLCDDKYSSFDDVIYV